MYYVILRCKISSYHDIFLLFWVLAIFTVVDMYTVCKIYSFIFYIQCTYIRFSYEYVFGLFCVKKIIILRNNMHGYVVIPLVNCILSDAFHLIYVSYLQLTKAALLDNLCRLMNFK